MEEECSLNPVTTTSLAETEETSFSPWVKAMGLTELTLGENSASGLLPQDSSLQRANGAICGQAIMAAIDTIVALAISTGEKVSKGTARQNTQFLRSAIGEDLRIESNVIKFGRTIAYAETHVYFAKSGKLVAHSTNEFVY